MWKITSFVILSVNKTVEIKISGKITVRKWGSSINCVEFLMGKLRFKINKNPWKIYFKLSFQWHSPQRIFQDIIFGRSQIKQKIIKLNVLNAKKLHFCLIDEKTFVFLDFKFGILIKRDLNLIIFLTVSLLIKKALMVCGPLCGFFMEM